MSDESNVVGEDLGTKEVGITIPGQKEFHMGYSRISSFFECPRRYKFSYVDKIKVQWGSPIRKGQAYHAVVETLLQKKKEGIHVKRSSMVDFTQQCGEFEELSEWDIKGLHPATQFYYDNYLELHKPLEIEVDFVVYRGGVKLTGRIDLVDESGWIIDHKCSYDIWAKERAQYGIQPMIYQWAALDQLEKQIPGFKFKGFAYNIIRVFPTPVMQELSIKKIKQEDSDWYEEQLGELAKLIKVQAFPGNAKHENCDRCSYKEVCQPVKYRLKELRSNENEEPQEDAFARAAV